MTSSIEILNELKGISPLLAELEKVNVFTVPDKYFASLPANISKVVFETKNSSSKNTFNVPSGYFDNLSSEILRRIKSDETASTSEELQILSPLLYSIKNENVFTVPDAYFKNLCAEIISKVKPAAKIIAIKGNSVWRIAAAAIVTGIIAVSSLLVSKTSMHSSQINNEIGIPSFAEVKSQYKNEEDINTGISKLSDDEIIKYLETTSNASDNEAVTTNIEEKELPAPQDYLQDEKTLDNYLNNIDKTGSQN